MFARLLILAILFSGQEHLRVQEGNSKQWIGRLFHVVSHVTFHVTYVTSAPLCCVLFLLVAFVGLGVCLVRVLVLFPRGALVDFFLTKF